MICVLSFFRNSAHGQAQNFMQQVQKLRHCTHFPVRVSAVYGDCEDNTKSVLQREAERYDLALTLTEHSHGGPVFGSTEGLDRLTALSALGNAGLATIRDDDDYVFYVESDLIWSPHVVLGLLEQLIALRTDAIIAPLVFAGEHFYDVFCYRKNGERFAPFYPYHSELKHDGSLTEVDSVGSSLLMTGNVARTCRMSESGVLMSLCASAWERGFPVLVDASQRITHPA